MQQIGQCSEMNYLQPGWINNIVTCVITAISWISRDLIFVSLLGFDAVSLCWKNKPQHEKSMKHGLKEYQMYAILNATPIPYKWKINLLFTGQYIMVWNPNALKIYLVGVLHYTQITYRVCKICSWIYLR